MYRFFRVESAELTMLRLYPQHAKFLLQKIIDPNIDITASQPTTYAKMKNQPYSKMVAGSLLRLGVLTPELGRLRRFRSNPSILARLGHFSSSANAINFTN